MPIHTEWYVPRRILITRYIGDISIDDLRADYRICAQMTQSLNHRVMLLVDLTQLRHYPMQISELNSLWKEGGQFRPLMSVAFGKMTPILILLANICAHSLRMEIRVVGTLKEALDLIAEHESAALV